MLAVIYLVICKKNMKRIFKIVIERLSNFQWTTWNCYVLKNSVTEISKPKSPIVSRTSNHIERSSTIKSHQISSTLVPLLYRSFSESEHAIP